MSQHLRPRSQILLLALVLRLALILGGWGSAQDTSLPFLARDSGSYIETATALGTTATFARDGEPNIVRTPGYPLLLVPGVWLGQIIAWALLLQLILHLLTILLVYDLAIQLGRPRAAIVAAGLLAIEPLSVIYTAKVLSETTFSALLVAAIWGLIRGHRHNSERHWLLGAACLGLSALVRPIGYGLALPLVLFAIVGLLFRQTRVVLPSRWLAAAIALMLLPSVLWQGRNLVVADYRGLSAITDINAYFYQAAAVEARRQGRSFYEVQNEWGYHDVDLFNTRRPDLARLPQGPRLQRLGEEGRQMIAADPFSYAGVHLRGMLRVVFDPGGVEVLRLLGMYPTSGGLLGKLIDQGIWKTLSDLAHERPELLILEIACGLLLLVIYAAAGRGAGRLVRAHPALAVLLIGGVVVLLVASGGPMSLSRFRHPMMPILCLFAGFGWPNAGSR